MNNLISRFYEHVSSGNSEAALEAIKEIQTLQAPKSLTDSLYFILESYQGSAGGEGGRKPAGEYYNRRISRGADERAPSTRIEIAPLVSIIVVSFNSSRELRDLMPSIADQSYGNLEVILVENGTEDNEDLLKEANVGGKHTYVKANNNVGFAEGNNIGAAHSKGEYLLLLNPDARLDPSAIKELLHGITKESTQALAACPKIYFFRDFVKVWIEKAPRGSRLSCEDLVKDLSYTKTFVREGFTSGCGNYVTPSIEGRICIDVPAPEGKETIQLLLVEGTGDEVEVGSAGSKAEVFIGDRSQATGLIEVGIPYLIPASAKIRSISRRLVNNASSGIGQSGMAHDVGFGDEDKNEYSKLTHVDAFCGCCVLMHRLTWVARRLFFPDFFAYFEDTELSNWIKLHHYQILYCPTSLVYHRHSETTQEKSPNWEYLVSRSRIIYKWMTGRLLDTGYAQQMVRELDTRGINKKLLSAVEGQYPTEALSDSRRSQKREKITVAVYNSYWTTKGGGEKHALDIASMVSQSESHEVYLLSDRDFDINELARYFDVDLSRCLAMRLDSVSSLATGFFDIFVNSTYCSLLLPRATKNYYIVSFPTKTLPSHVGGSYKFLHNSEFTQRWAKRYWGAHDGIVIHPVIGCRTPKSIGEEKKKLILSIGRFNYQGHCKNQHFLIQAFYQAKESGELGSDWHLTIAGSVNQAEPTSVAHYEDCVALVRDESATVIPNAERSNIITLYNEAFAYVHGTGMDIDVEQNPEQCEHFGISVFDAITHGCIPIVHDSGGAKDILSFATNGMAFQGMKDLVVCLSTLEALFSQYREGSANTLPRDTVSRAEKAIRANQSLVREIMMIT